MRSNEQSLEKISRRLAIALRRLSAEKRISRLLTTYVDRAVVATSFGPTSAVMLHMASMAHPGIRVLHVRHGHETENTLRFAEDCQRQFQIDLRIFEAPKLDIPLWGTTEFEEFCRLVKVEPMRNALKNESAEIWFAGNVHNETAERRMMPIAQPRLGAIAIYPILDWVLEDTMQYCRTFNLKLNDDYFDPCKGPEQKLECGLHSDKQYRLSLAR